MEPRPAGRPSVRAASQLSMYGSPNVRGRTIPVMNDIAQRHPDQATPRAEREHRAIRPRPRLDKNPLPSASEQGRSMTTVVNVRNVNPWDPDVVYVGRANPRIGLKGSKWANPFKIGPFTREESIDAYRTFIQTEIREKPLLYRLD